MYISRLDDKTLALSQLDPFYVELLRQVPIAADPQGNEAAQQRLYSAPADASERELIDSWKKYVEPGLRSIFLSANEIVAGDLMQFDKEKSGGLASYNLRIPIKHIENWLNSLNQARLAIAARRGFTEEDINAEIDPAINSDRDLALFQIHFYGFLQEIFIRELEGD